MNSRILKVTMALGLVLVGLGISIAGAAATKLIDLTLADPTNGQKYAAETSHTMGQLFSLINTNNPANNSQFLMLAANGGKAPMAAADYTKNSNFKNMGSISPLNAQGGTGTVKADGRALFLTAGGAPLATTVTLKAPTDAHLNAVMTQYAAQAPKYFTSILKGKNKSWSLLKAQTEGKKMADKNAAAVKEKIQKLLVWFEYQGYAMFIFNPWSPSLLSELAKWRTS